MGRSSFYQCKSPKSCQILHTGPVKLPAELWDGACGQQSLHRHCKKKKKERTRGTLQLTRVRIRVAVSLSPLIGGSLLVEVVLRLHQRERLCEEGATAYRLVVPETAVTAALLRAIRQVKRDAPLRLEPRAKNRASDVSALLCQLDVFTSLLCFMSREPNVGGFLLTNGWYTLNLQCRSNNWKYHNVSRLNKTVSEKTEWSLTGRRTNGKLHVVDWVTPRGGLVAAAGEQMQGTCSPAHLQNRNLTCMIKNVHLKACTCKVLHSTDVWQHCVMRGWMSEGIKEWTTVFLWLQRQSLRGCCSSCWHCLGASGYQWGGTWGRGEGGFRPPRCLGVPVPRHCTVLKHSSFFSYSFLLS